MYSWEMWWRLVDFIPQSFTEICQGRYIFCRIIYFLIFELQNICRNYAWRNSCGGVNVQFTTYCSSVKPFPATCNLICGLWGNKSEDKWWLSILPFVYLGKIYCHELFIKPYAMVLFIMETFCGLCCCTGKRLITFHSLNIVCGFEVFEF